MADDVLEAPRSLQVLADPHRWAIVRHLARSDRRVGELTALLGEPQNLVSYHLRELRDAGLVSSRRSSFDGRDAYYRVDLDRCSALLGDAGAAIHPASRLAPIPQPTPRRRTKAPEAKVLFLCTGNSARSQMAAALLEERSGGAIAARSAGSHPKALHPNAVRAMAERGIDISGNTTRHLRRYARSHFDYVITLCDKVREVCPEFPGGPNAHHWSIADPAGEGSTDEESYPAFQRTADELEQRIRHLIADLLDRQS
jgi:protein-tyrosine-phosphatase/DNA-binding transcriptional ArsR family regulator